MINNISSTDTRCLQISVRTWSRDSHGLYDYECSSTKNNNFKIKKEHQIIRKKNEVNLIDESTYQEEQNEENLGKIYVDLMNRFFFANRINYRMNPNEENINNLQNKIWYIIRSEEPANSKAILPLSALITNENDFAELKLNDIIKLGRVKYAVTELKINNIKSSIDQANPEYQVFNLIPEYVKQKNVNLEGVPCKICLTNHEVEENPLVTLCKCSGSMEFVHYLCVKQWMNMKLSTKENELKTVLSYNMRSFNCEICKTPYPLRFRYDNGQLNSYYEIIECIRPSSENYIVLESLNQLKDNNNYKSIHVITLNDNHRIVMGRGHDSDVRINDISVSRTHSCLTLNNKKILLKDYKSKFGTLILVQNEIEVKENKLSLQIGRSYFETMLLNKVNEKYFRNNLRNSNEKLNKSVNNSSNNISIKKPIFRIVNLN